MFPGPNLGFELVTGNDGIGLKLQTRLLDPGMPWGECVLLYLYGYLKIWPLATGPILIFERGLVERLPQMMPTVSMYGRPTAIDIG